MDIERDSKLISRQFGEFVANLVLAGIHSLFEIYYQNRIIYQYIESREKFFPPEAFVTLSLDEKDKFIDTFYKNANDFAESLSSDEDKLVSYTIASGLGNIKRFLVQELDKEQQKTEQTTRPEYIKHMFEKGIVYPDGKTVVTTLVDAAYHLIAIEEMKIDPNFLQNMFLKKDGTHFSQERPAPREKS
jgi:hypothetical protein